MPNFDAGHYFLTVLVPIRPNSILINGQSQSHAHLLKEALALMPLGECASISPTTARDDLIASPFTRTTRTHFARAVVLDDVVFNGRKSCDSLISTILRINPLAPQKVDSLTTPFLILAVDFDAASGDDSVLRDYLTALWESMGPELVNLFQHCVSFDNITAADDFYRYIKRCQIETTMPFNDYWSVTPALTDFRFTPYLIAAGVALLVLVAGLFMSGWMVLLGLLAIVVTVVVGVMAITAKGKEPFPVSPPPGPAPDLPTVLKALALQRNFTAFVIANQGQDDQALHAAFGGFLAGNQPNDTRTATQPPGVIGV
jgi:hypothetical protein